MATSCHLSKLGQPLCLNFLTTEVKRKPLRLNQVHTQCLAELSYMQNYKVPAGEHSLNVRACGTRQQDTEHQKGLEGQVHRPVVSGTALLS